MRGFGAGVLLFLLFGVAIAQDTSSCPEGDKALLGAINMYRELHDATALTWNDQLAAAALERALNLSTDNCGSEPPKTQNNTEFGENLWVFKRFTPAEQPPVSCSEGVGVWYAQINNYNWTSRPFTDNKDHLDEIGSFTELIWATNMQVGCGYHVPAPWVQDLGGVDYVGSCGVLVCQFISGGNVGSDLEFLRNVREPVGMLSPPPSPAPPPPLTTDGTSTCFEGDDLLLQRINARRAQAQAPPLTWDPSLVDSAKVWADAFSANQCKGAEKAPDRTPGVGQNYWLLGNYSSDKEFTFSCLGVVDTWFSQKDNYTFSATPWADNQAKFAQIGMFTQLVWASSSYVGCYMSKPDPWPFALAGETMFGHCMTLVCHFRAAGNVAGNPFFLQNVREPAPYPPSPPLPPSPSPPPAPPPSPDYSGLNSNCPEGDADVLNVMNEFRAQHETEPLVWSLELVQSAKNWALNLSANQCGGGSVRVENKIGEAENLWMQIFYSTAPTDPYVCADAVKSWYGHLATQGYQYTATPFTDNYGILARVGTSTQLLWKSTTDVGCYFSKPGTWSTSFLGLPYITTCNVVVCKFTPPGNNLTDGEYANNVLPPKAAPPSPPVAPDLAACPSMLDDDLLTKINDLRDGHLTSTMTWDPALVASAKTYAEKIAGNFCPSNLSPSGTGGVGELVFVKKQDSVTPQNVGRYTCGTAVDTWYAQGTSYNFSDTPWTSNMDNFLRIGSFSQLMWDSSTRIGCYYGYNSTTGAGNQIESECVVVICHMSPPGNRPNDAQFLANVKPFFIPSPSPPPSPPKPPSPPSVKETASSGNCPEKDAIVLAAVNSLRLTHGASPLVWDYSLVYSAKEYNKKLKKQCVKGTTPASEIDSLGETRYMRKFNAQAEDAKPFGCVTAMNQWYGQGSAYKYTKTPADDNVLSDFEFFTQLVWLNTTNIGCYWDRKVIQNGDAFANCVVVVCHWTPPGNEARRSEKNEVFFANVLKP